MNELIITIMLVIPSPHKLVNWSVNQIPTQIQITYETGLEVSYSATPVSCSFRPRHAKEMVFRSPNNRCYSVYDLSSPRFVRHPDYWYKVELPKPPLVNLGE
jgi:hypothetical protein|tara:strand:+ start:1288 stop:1593 length:306 start_codon:yes stop_codon:yes gene_type:complete